jgi:hypothetical protein
MGSEAIEEINPFFVGYPSGKFFVGREKELNQFKELLSSLSGGYPSNLYIVGKGGTGKTSFLEKIVQEARSKGVLSFISTLDSGKSGEINIDTIIRRLLENYEKVTKQKGFVEKWENEDPTFKASKPIMRLRSDELAKDFSYICKLIKEKNLGSCVICIDEGQAIHPLALSTLKKSLQILLPSDRCFMLVLSLLNETELTDKDFGERFLTEHAKLATDPGAKRFFEHPIQIGVFESENEARYCITKRLEKNKIKFDDDTVSLIIDIMRKHPRKMVKHAHRVYELKNQERQYQIKIWFMKHSPWNLRI